MKTRLHMSRLLLCLPLVPLLCSCGGKDYEYADRCFELYEDIVEKYEETESVEELDAEREKAREAYRQLEEELADSHQELIKDLEQYNEDTYLLHLDLLKAESHAQWMYSKKRLEFEKQ